MAHEDAEYERAATLMRAHNELAQVAEPRAIVASLVRVCEPYAPKSIHLVYIYNDSEGRPETSEVVDVWGPDVVPPVTMLLGQKFRIADSSMGRAIVANPSTPLIVPDIELHPETAAVMRTFPGPVRAFVGLPLYSKRHATWQGIVVFHWSEPHDPSPAERLLYELMRTTLAESIAAERTMLAYREALADNTRLLERAELALQESQRQRTMLQLILDNLPIGVLVLRSTDSEVELINRAGRGLLGFDPERGAVDVNLLSFHQPGVEEPVITEESAGARALQTNSTTRDELEVKLQSGERKLLDLTASPLLYEGDPTVRLVALFQDITALRRNERERLAAQEELLQVQALALAERSIPLIPIREDVLILPLIGTLDEERGRQLMDTLVHLGGRNNVRATIIDVTGVRNLDTAAAHALLSAARALRLRGVQPILTGIQSNAAMTLVSLGVDLSGILVRGTLQDAVALATQRTRGATPATA